MITDPALDPSAEHDALPHHQLAPETARRAAPMAMPTLAAARARLIDSLKTTQPMTAATTVLLSRSAATAARFPRVCAHSTKP